MFITHKMLQKHEMCNKYTLFEGKNGKMKYYAVRNGRQPGIYLTWDDCRAQTYKYSGAAYKSFETKEEAEAYMIDDRQQAPLKKGLPIAYIDGTYRKDPPLYGYGGFILDGGRRHIIQGTGDDPAYTPYRNIAGEVMGAIEAAFTACSLELNEITLCHDYAGVSEWARGTWDAQTPLTEYYRDTMTTLQNSITIHFVRVDGHTGVIGNEIADYLAKEAVGARLRKKDLQALEDFKSGRLTIPEEVST